MNISEKSKKIIDSCRFCWMCRHVCPIGNATGLERNTARARALGASLVVRGATELSEIADNVYECMLCGACTNNCMTGWDPKVFIYELRREIVYAGCAPEYIKALISKRIESGNVFGLPVPEKLTKAAKKNGKTLFFAGATAVHKAPECVLDALGLIEKAGEKCAFDPLLNSGADLWFLTGKTKETFDAASRCAQVLSGYDQVVVYDPKDLAFLLHECREWGVEIKTSLVSFNEYLNNLIDSGKIKVNKSEKEYALQDSYAYARDLGDCESGRKIIDKVGARKEMLLIGKEADAAGELIMREYMPAVIDAAARNRWTSAKNMNCFTLVTESPDEYVTLLATKPENFEVLTIEKIILNNMGE